MKNLLCLLVAFIFSFQATAQNEYQYSIDINTIENDRVSVELLCPKISESEIIFVIPRVIPGSYSDKKFAQFIKKFRAEDKEGNKLKYKLVDKSHFIIYQADKLYKITYDVDDTWDVQSKKKYIFEPGGSNIAQGKNVVLNNHAFFGYFENYKSLPFKIEIVKPESFFASTYLETVSKSKTEDLLIANDYFELGDNPVLYCVPDTTSFKISNTTIYVSVYNKDNSTTSEEIAEYMQPLAKALESFFEGKLPTDEYWFLIYLEELDNMKKHGGYGALEHHHSSFYYLPETKMKSRFKQMILDISAHEFLHVLTPLNLHSTHIADFNYRNPVMSEHLWLYEGVTEYFSHLVQLQAGLIDSERFFEEMRSKMNRADDYPAFSMTEMSTNVLDNKYKDLYSSVYTKGAVLAFLLDLEIIRLTEGEKTLKDALLQLTKKYGPENPFKDENIIQDLSDLTHPDLQLFFDQYVIGEEEPDYSKMLNLIGWDYKRSFVRDIYYFGDLPLKFEDGKFIFTNNTENAFGIMYGDVLIAVDDNDATEDNINDLYKEYFRSRENDDPIYVKINRAGYNKTLKGIPLEAKQTQINYIYDLNEETEIRKIWMGNQD